MPRWKYGLKFKNSKMADSCFAQQTCLEHSATSWSLLATDTTKVKRQGLCSQDADNLVARQTSKHLLCTSIPIAMEEPQHQSPLG